VTSNASPPSAERLGYEHGVHRDNDQHRPSRTRQVTDRIDTRECRRPHGDHEHHGGEKRSDHAEPDSDR